MDLTKFDETFPREIRRHRTARSPVRRTLPDGNVLPRERRECVTRYRDIKGPYQPSTATTTSEARERSAEQFPRFRATDVRRRFNRSRRGLSQSAIKNPFYQCLIERGRTSGRLSAAKSRLFDLNTRKSSAFLRDVSG